MTDNPFAALLDGVPRLVFTNQDHKPEPYIKETAVLAALAAAYPADLAEAGKVLEGVTPGKWRQHLVDETTVVSPDGSQVCCTFPNGGTDDDADYEANWETHEANARFIAWCREGVPALLARIAAQEAQIAEALKKWAREYGRADATETALAAMTKERDYADGTNEVLRGENQRLETSLAAEKAKVAKLVEAWDLARSHSLVKVTLGDGDARKSWGDFLIAMDEARAAIKEAGQ